MYFIILIRSSYKTYTEVPRLFIKRINTYGTSVIVAKNGDLFNQKLFINNSIFLTYFISFFILLFFFEL